MTQYGVATVDNPPEGSTDFVQFTSLGEPEDQHGPANAWHYMGGAEPDMRAFGHVNNDRREFITFLQEKLPTISSPDCIEVGCTGYWNRVKPIEVPRYAQTVDQVGRNMFFIGDNVLMLRYLKGDSIIWYQRDERWSHRLGSQKDIERWRKQVAKCVA